MSSRAPKEIHEERLKMHNANVANRVQYFDPKTGSFYENLLEDRPCPTCKENHEHFLFFKDGGRYVKCTQCDIVYLNPVFKDENLEKYYRTNHDLQSEIVANDGDFYTNIYSKGLRAIERVAPKGNILDIGCSAGIFLDLAKEAGWKTYGVELNEREASYATAKGHTIYNKFLNEVTFESPLEAICLWDVFEHLKDGEVYLNDMKALLAKSGVVFLQIPSADSLAAKMLREKCNMYDGIEHVNLYSCKSIEKLAQKCGFEIESCETVIGEIGVMNNYLNYEDPYFGNSTNTKTFLGGLDEKWLHDQKMGYKMQLVLRKKG